MTPRLDSLPETITAPRTDPIYNCHGYLTKVPIGAIEPFIETFTQQGEVIADFFAGSGMTGLAAVRLGRKARLSDISALGRHIAIGYSTNINPELFQETAKTVVAKARSAIGELYSTRRATDNEVVEMVRAVWSFTYVCPSCKAPLVYYRHLSKTGAPPKSCPSCNVPFVRRTWGRGADVPVEVVARNTGGRLAEQAVSDFDLQMIEQATHDPRQKEVPCLVIDKDREMFSRSGLGKAGMVRTADFFSPRNAIALLELWRALNAVEDAALRQKLRFAFTAILPRASRRYQWSAQRPLNAQNQTYYIAPVYYEWNVFELFGRKVEAALRADEILFLDGPLLRGHSEKDIDYTLASADHLAHLASESVDYVFTDPPFGSNIFYSDMNLFHEAWLGEVTNHASEAVVHTTGTRKQGASERYEALLRSAFAEAFRVLKPGRYMSVVFGNSSGQIWGLVQRAMRDAGFKAAPAHVAILDKGQRSVKGLNSGSESVVTVDLVLTVQKPAIAERADDAHPLENGDTQRLINEVIEELSTEQARNPSHVYARILRKAIHEHYTLDQLHLTDVLLALRNAGYTTNHKTGLICLANAGTSPRVA
ncbi:MAG TPA: DNA methyltransferase [Candidatus Dormibacteraeota bacterium]|nr:DNA methyltransferase [Candidatus Dormibacteraeota bacterium]